MYGDYSNYYLESDEMVFEGLIASILAFFVAYLAIIFVVTAIAIIAKWKVFTKSGKPGWSALIPIYNTYVLFEIVGMKGWYAFFGLIPGAGACIIAVMTIIAYVKLSKCFGKDTGFAVGLILLPIVFLPMLGFDKSTYTGPQPE